MNDILLKEAQLSSGIADIAIKDGKIVAIREGILDDARTVYPLGERVVLPGFVDSHVHLDKAFTLQHCHSHIESLHDAIASWRGIRERFSTADYLDRATGAVGMAVAAGTTAMRTHVDVSPDVGLVALEAMLELKQRVSRIMDLQIVAMGRYGVSKEESKAMCDALDAGADIIGGAPLLTPEPIHCLRKTLDLAERYGKPVDLHVDETENDGFSLLHLACEVQERGFSGGVTAGHCISLSSLSKEVAEYGISLIHGAGINIITLPSCNLVLQGRQSGKRGITRVKELVAAGVHVSTASDNVQDPFNPFGNYDMLWLANLTAHAAHMTSAIERQQVLDMITYRPARILGLQNYGLHEGAQADLVVLDTPDYENILAFMPPRWAVFKRGVLVFESGEARAERRFKNEQ